VSHPERVDCESCTCHPDRPRCVAQPNRSYWVDAHTWVDPDCVECSGDGAPCCEPPDGPSPGDWSPCLGPCCAELYRIERGEP